MWWVCVFQVAELCTKCWELCSNLTINGTIWVLKRCMNYTNKVFHLRDTAILHYLFTSQPLCNLFIFRATMANLSLCLSKHYKVNKNRDIAWNIINVGTNQRWVVSFILQLLYAWHPLHKRLCMLQTPAGLWKERSLPAGNRTLTFHSSNLQFPHFIRKLGGGDRQRETTPGIQQTARDHIWHPLYIYIVYTVVSCETDTKPWTQSRQERFCGI